MGRKISGSDSPYVSNFVDQVTFTIGAQSGRVINVAMQLKDPDFQALSGRGWVRFFLADDANGDTPIVTPPSGGLAVGTNGAVIPGTSGSGNQLLVRGVLAIDAVPEKFKTTATAVFTINGMVLTKAAATAIVFSSAHVINATKFGVVLIQINAAGTVSTKVPLTPQIYTSAPLALAALPTPDAGNVSLGYIAIAAGAGNWTANTDDMTNGSDLTTAAFNDTALSVQGAKVFDGISESNGTIDINITEAAAKTLYVICITPDGQLHPSGAVTFV